jgi:4-deoxy-L-threo-5-hexosulose-uronate ketol-isomerase
MDGPIKRMIMQVIFAHSATETATMDTAALRRHFLVTPLMQPDQLLLTYTHYDRLIVGGAMPVQAAITLSNPAELRAKYFLERRELGIINIGGAGRVETGQGIYNLSQYDCLYLGKGTQSVQFISERADEPALFYLLSAPAHAEYPAAVCAKQQAMPVELGSAATSNHRTVYKYIHLEGIRSCQLVMGLTVLEPGSVWNSVPPHTHTRRSEIYFYFQLPEGQRLFHFMGDPKETRHLVMANHEAVVSPPWSTHFGCGTSNYGFIWGMAGENLEYTDMDPASVDSLL